MGAHGATRGQEEEHDRSGERRSILWGGTGRQIKAGGRTEAREQGGNGATKRVSEEEEATATA